MAELGALDAARTLAGPVGYLGGRWMTDPATYAHGAEQGVDGFAFYFVGRGGALGDVSGEVVAATMPFFAPALAIGMWNEGRSVLSPSDALAAFSQCCWSWADRRLGGASAAVLARTAALTLSVVDAADAAGVPLFAGWRRAPRPQGQAPLALHALHLLRELRGALHTVAVRGSGLTPLEAMVASTPGAGFGSPQSFGWSDPPPCTDDLRERRAVVEAATDELMAPAFAVLAAADRAELAGHLADLRAAAKTG